MNLLKMQWIFAAFMIATGFYLMRSTSARHVAIKRLLFLGFILVGISILLFSDTWTKFSNYLGVGSSTQLLIYLLTFAFISSTVSNYRWRREQEQRIVELTRNIAVISNEKSNHNPDK